MIPWMIHHGRVAAGLSPSDQMHCERPRPTDVGRHLTRDQWHRVAALCLRPSQRPDRAVGGTITPDTVVVIPVVPATKTGVVSIVGAAPAPGKHGGCQTGDQQ